MQLEVLESLRSQFLWLVGLRVGNQKTVGVEYLLALHDIVRETGQRDALVFGHEYLLVDGAVVFVASLDSYSHLV